MIYELKVTLTDVGVPVWRKLQVDSSTTFGELHQILQVAFDWDDFHLHSFFVRKTEGKQTQHTEIAPDETEIGGFPGPHGNYSEKEETLADWFKTPKDKVMYLYDFGDSWEHNMVLEKILKPEKEILYPQCTAAKNLAPEEDSRGEVMMGEVDLQDDQPKMLVQGINERIHEELSDLLTAAADSGENDCWEDVLRKAKAYHKLKPWKYMYDDQIFLTRDPVSGERLFCSILGSGEETFGLAVYIGEDGFASLIDIFSGSGSGPSFELLLKQRSLLLSFEDREDLEKADYTLVKTYDVPFRGRKTWPAFRSQEPGYLPWFMNDEEAKIMNAALDAAIDFAGAVANGLELPEILVLEDGFINIAEKSTNVFVFTEQLLDREGNKKEIPLSISEFELKQAEKNYPVLEATIEFSMEYLDMPVQHEPGSRPAFPLMAIAADHEHGLVVYQDLLEGGSDPVNVQKELLKTFETMGGIPAYILLDETTAQFVEPLLKALHLQAEVRENLPVVEEVMQGLAEMFEE